jgi:hypothetical protein
MIDGERTPINENYSERSEMSALGFCNSFAIGYSFICRLFRRVVVSVLFAYWLDAKSCCNRLEARLLASKVFHDCSGGNSRPSRLSGVGGGIFLEAMSASLFLLAHDLQYEKRKRPADTEHQSTAQLDRLSRGLQSATVDIAHWLINCSVIFPHLREIRRC